MAKKKRKSMIVVKQNYECLKAKYRIIINAFNLVSAELYDRTMTFKTKQNLQEFKEYLIKEANK